MKLDLRPLAWLLLASLALPVAAQDLGRLFTTPEERARLDKLRRAGTSTDTGAGAGTQDAERAPVEGERILMVNGIVTRSGSARSTTWIDAVPVDDYARRPAGVGAVVREGGRLGVGVTLLSGRRVTLRPGQSVDAVTGQVREAYEPPAPPPAPRTAPEPDAPEH